MNKLILGFFAFLVLVSCSKLLPHAVDSDQILAEPIQGLTQVQLNTHLRGDQEFAKNFTPELGLGPIFVAASCESCHPGDGKGHPLHVFSRFGKWDGNVFDHMLSQGGPQLQSRSIDGYLPEVLPSEAVNVTTLIAPAVTGLGYLEAVSDSFLLQLSDPLDLDNDGISGVPNWITSPEYFIPTAEKIQQNGKFIGRFGKKAGAINLLHQTVNAYIQDMGISSAYHPTDLTNTQILSAGFDEVEIAEISSAVVDNVVFYLKTLKVPPRRNKLDPEVLTGEVLFDQIGCAKCHVSQLSTGVSDLQVLNKVDFYPYTDLLLHDMGEELNDGYTEGTALSTEWRTAPLWGIGLVADSQGGNEYYLHDGRARSLEEAISFHGGEGSDSRAAFQELNLTEKDQLITFLQSL